MFRVLAVLSLSLGLAAAAAAQEADTLTAADGWRSSLTAALAGNQAAYANWQEGGVDALAATASVEGLFDRVVGGALTSQSLRLAFGVLRQDTLAFRKATDVVRYGARVERATGGPLRPVASLTVRTQFAPGYDYSPDSTDYPTLPVAPGRSLKVSDTFSPLVLTQSVGVAYRPGGGLVVRTGVALKETVVGIGRLRPLFGNAPDEVVRPEAGVDGELLLERGVMENVRLRSRLYGFQAFGQIGNDAPDLLFENTVLLKVNSLVNVTLDAAALYDADISGDLQLRESIAVGLAVDLIRGG